MKNTMQRKGHFPRACAPTHGGALDTRVHDPRTRGNYSQYTEAAAGTLHSVSPTGVPSIHQWKGLLHPCVISVIIILLILDCNQRTPRQSSWISFGSSLAASRSISYLSSCTAAEPSA
ncbi:unnamed protein product, partial [Ectocarpus sp. 12 AP-2014]